MVMLRQKRRLVRQFSGMGGESEWSGRMRLVEEGTNETPTGESRR
jgi:hypothetical protein